MENISTYNYWLGEGEYVTHLHCPKNIEEFAQGQPDTIVFHYTAGSSGKSSAEYLARNDVKASAHLVIDRSGHIYQLVPFNIISWHAGKSEYNKRKGYNKFSIGIELDNAGILTPENGHFVSQFGRQYPTEEVIKAIHKNENKERFWHSYTPIQIKMAIWVCAILMVDYPTIHSILGHDDIAPGRKLDPGPAFPMKRFKALMGE